MSCPVLNCLGIADPEVDKGLHLPALHRQLEDVGAGVHGLSCQERPPILTSILVYLKQWGCYLMSKFSLISFTF